jgi:rRNA processing protein Krr1/Pno1
MVLKRNDATVQQQPGGFEQEDSNVGVAERPAAEAPAAQAAPAAEAVAAAAATTAIAKASAGGALAVKVEGVEDVIGKAQNAYPPVQFGAFDRLIGSNGQVMDAQKKLLGSKVTVELLSWNYVTVLSPGDDTAEAKEAVRYSLDGKTLDDGSGKSCDDYLEELRTVHGYTKASKKVYIEVLGILESAEKETPLIGQVVQVSLSPTSAVKFVPGHQVQVRVKRRTGALTEEQARKLVIEAVVKTNTRNQTFTYLSIGSP